MANTRQKALAKVDTDIQEPHAEVTQFDIKSMIYVIRNQQVMIDSDLAMLYQVETKRLNEAILSTLNHMKKRLPKHLRSAILPSKA